MICQCNHCRSRRERRLFSFMVGLVAVALAVPWWPMWEAAMRPLIRSIRHAAISQGLAR